MSESNIYINTQHQNMKTEDKTPTLMKSTNKHARNEVNTNSIFEH